MAHLPTVDNWLLLLRFSLVMPVPAKARSPISCTDVPKLTWTSDEQSSKAASPSLRNWLGDVTDSLVSPLQRMKAPSPIVVTLEGNTTLERAVQPAKA